MRIVLALSLVVFAALAVQIAILDYPESESPTTAAAEAATPGPAPVSYYNDVQPIFNEHCATETCHGAAAPQAGLSLVEDVSYVNLYRQNGVAPDTWLVLAHEPGESLLLRRLIGAGPLPRMPLQNESLSGAEIAIIARWIEQGAVEDVENKGHSPTSVVPRLASLEAFDETWPRLELQPVVTDLEAPTKVTHAGDGSGRLFVTEQAGRVRVVEDGVLAAEPVIDLSDRVRRRSMEDGLLAVAFPPGEGPKDHFFASYVHVETNELLVSRFDLAAAGGTRAEPDSERILLRVPRPEEGPLGGTHYGGDLAFGPDGFLYVSTGDGSGTTPVGDRFEVAQDPGELLGKILRIDVSGGGDYTIPAGNPFVADPDARPEVWAYGLRNPWRISFDRLTGDLFIGNVGHQTREAIYYQPASSPGGVNYGWGIVEGTVCIKPEFGCDLDYQPPVYEYAHFGHREEDSVIGGFVYRGAGNCRMQGNYIFADWLGALFVMRPQAGGWETRAVVNQDTPNLFSSLGEGEDGTLYGVVYRQKADLTGLGSIVRIADPSGPQGGC